MLNEIDGQTISLSAIDDTPLREYFRSVWTTVYQFWAHLIWTPKLGEPGKKICESK